MAKVTECMEVSENDIFRLLSETQTAVARLHNENHKMRRLLRDTWILFLSHGSVSPNDLPMVDNVRERLNEFGIEVTDEEQKCWQHSDD